MEYTFNINDFVVPESTILVVDDMPQNLKLLSTLLAKEKYNISVATNGFEALEIVKELHPDLILLDVMMPEMDGFTVCKEIKSNSNTSHIPIIFVSAKNELVDIIKGFHLGGSDYITKPFQAAEVLARVKTHIELKKTQDAINKYNLKLESLVETRTRELIRSEKHAAFSLFMKGIIHNLKNPLTGIMGNTELSIMQLHNLSQKIKPDDACENLKLEDCNNEIETLKNKMKSISKSSNRLLELINSLLAKSRSEQEGKAKEYNLNELIKQELEFLNGDLRFKRLSKKTISLSEDAANIKIVASDFSQVIQNLVQNALDVLQNKRDARLVFNSGTDESHVWLSIEDNGPGIPIDLQHKIFDPFFTTKNEEEIVSSDGPIGTGLGLYTCQEIIKSYNGIIELHSEEGSGAKFIVKLPKI